jgi:hypothetical protein
MSLKRFNYFYLFIFFCFISSYLFIFNKININNNYLSQQTSSSNCKNSITIDLINELYSQILPQHIPKFPLYNNSFNLISNKNSLIPPTWIVTLSNVSTIHRFFDSSPFSPSG